MTDPYDDGQPGPQSEDDEYLDDLGSPEVAREVLDAIRGEIGSLRNEIGVVAHDVTFLVTRMIALEARFAELDKAFERLEARQEEFVRAIHTIVVEARTILGDPKGSA